MTMDHGAAAQHSGPRLAGAAFGLAGMLLLAGCASDNEIVVDSGVGVTASRTLCPAVGVPDYTGDVTLFSAAGSSDSRAIDVVANLTNLRSQCSESADKVYAQSSFTVMARRSDARGPRTVTLPYFTTIVRAGSAVVAKRVGTVTLNFADGQDRAQATAQGGAYIDRAAATLPEDIRERITRKRRAGDADAAVDPLSDPEVRAALSRASFEMLIGFQLTQDQLQYNATR